MCHDEVLLKGAVMNIQPPTPDPQAINPISKGVADYLTSAVSIAVEKQGETNPMGVSTEILAKCAVRDHLAALIKALD